jgi:hypothetical protein
LGDLRVAPLLPDELLERSPRFNGIDRKQLEEMKQRLPNRANQPKG